MDVLLYPDERLAFLTILLLLVPAALYILALGSGKWGGRFFLAGLAMHLISILQRGIHLGRLPLAEKHDTISFMALSMALAYIYLSRRRGGTRGLELTLVPLTVIFVLVAALNRTIDTISPFMLTPWFYMHVLFYFLSFALLGVSACLGAGYVMTGEREHEALQHRFAIWAWTALCGALLWGSIWFYSAYGSYWLWSAKELWITISWFALGLYLHARLMNWLKGKPAAIIGCLCFGVALFTYFGVGTILPSPPTQF